MSKRWLSESSSSFGVVIRHLLPEGVYCSSLISAEQALAARLSTTMLQAEEWEKQLRAQHDAEIRQHDADIRHMRDVAAEKERQREGDDVR
jgi:hypothetical protein